MSEAQCRAAGFVLGGLTLLVGAAVLVGWTLEIAALTTPWAGRATMKANTAAALALSGAAVCFEARAEAWSSWRAAVRICASFTTVVALLTLGEDVFHVDLGIDRLLLVARAPELTPAPGRMAPNTAVCLTLIGSALVLGHAASRRVRTLSHVFVLVVLVVAFVALAGYAYSATALYDVPGFESMALPTALGLAALALGTLLCRPQQGVTRLLVQQNLAGAALRRSLPVLLLGPFFIGWVRLQGQRAGWYGTEFGLGLVIVASTVVLCAVSLWNARVQGEAELTLEQVRRDQHFSLRLGEMLRAATDPAAVVFETAKAIGEYLDAARALFIEVDAEGDRVIWHRDYCRGLPSVAGESALSSFDPNALAYARSGRTAVSADTSADPQTAERYASTYLPMALRARILVPLFRDGQWAGGLVVGSNQPRVWQEREIGLVDLAAERAWEWSERLRAYEQLRLAIEESPLGKITVDRHGRIAYVNREAERLFGYSRSELIGQSVDVLVPQAKRAQHRSLREGFAATPRARSMGAGRKLRAARRDGTEFPVEIALTPMQGSEGGIVLVSIIDVTVRVSAEEARERMFLQLELMNAELEQRVHARTEELTRTLSERGVLLQEIHHRVKNNLQVISSLLKMQARRSSEGASRTALEECEGRVATISLIHETLYQAKDYGKVPFAEYARSLITNVFRAHDAASERVRLEVTVDPVVLAVDKAIPCGLILNELITNALKHAFPDGREGRVLVELRQSADGVVRMSVSDDGIGMPADDGTWSKSLGMQLVRALVEQLGATLAVVREHGTRVQVEFSAEAAR